MTWYQRDATWWASPDCYKPKKYHLKSDKGKVAACNTQAILDTDFSGSDKPPESLKCKRCQKLNLARN